MGTIRGTHTSPGVYTKITALRKPGDSTSRAKKSTDTAFVNIGGGGGNTSVYFGWFAIRTYDGMITEKSLATLKNITEKDIKGAPHINPYKIPKTETHLTGGKSLVMPCTVTMKQLEELIEKEGCEYVDVADVKNNCVVIAIPKKYYEDPNFDVIDETFGKSIKENFNKIKEFMMGTNKYVLLCMFNEYFAYATIGEDKVISPITLKVKNV